MSEKLTLTAKEAAAFLGVSLPTLYALARSDGFPCLRVGLRGVHGKKLLFPIESLKRWIEEQTGA